ncbi:MAG TPA: hypothetical protein VIL85_16725 [Thermomicrobiales bacterium]|jgi:hypothetical protein
MIPLHTAEQLARHAQALLAPACHQIMVVGSVRRRKPQTKDVEMAVISKPAQPVFGDAASSKSRLDALLARLLLHGDLKLPTPDRRVDGPRQKRFLIPQAGGVELELWIADAADNWGNTVAIRTGDYEFSKLLVTQRRDGGCLPNGWMHAHGYLWPFRLKQDERARLTARNAPEPPIACPTEDDFFVALGVPPELIPHPMARDRKMAERLRGRLSRERKAG